MIDNPINNPEGCFVKSGLMDAVGAAGGEVWLPSASLFGQVKVGSLRIPDWEALYRPLEWADKLIGIPTVKSHNLSGATLTMKNWYGLLGGPRNRLHQAINEVITDLGQFDFMNRRMRLITYHPGVALKRIQNRTGFELEIAPDLYETPPPTADELELLRYVIDPLGIRRLELLSGASRREKLREILAKEKE